MDEELLEDHGEDGLAAVERAIAEEEELRRLITESFRPMVPVSQKDLFAGRIPQINLVFETVYQAGQHAAIYGERGVGKTSLASFMSHILRPNRLSMLVTCAQSDSFGDIWHRVLRDFTMTSAKEIGFRREEVISDTSLDDLLPEPSDVRPDDVRRVLQVLSEERPVVIFLDEFDRLQDSTHIGMFADTLKVLSDHAIEATIIVVGVADDVNDLIAEHRSTERALAQIQMPRMRPEELSDIIKSGLANAGMEISETAQERIVRLSQGLPHYTHLLTQVAALDVVSRGERRIVAEDVLEALTVAVDRSQQSVQFAYQEATSSNRTDSLYRQVLLACALCETDDLGFFAPADVRTPLSRILDKKVEIPAFAQHLTRFSGGDKRAPVLQKKGRSHMYRYRFINPLLQPYVIMRGVQDRMVSVEDVVTSDS